MVAEMTITMLQSTKAAEPLTNATRSGTAADKCADDYTAAAACKKCHAHK
jgi:hypothetical protein